MILRPQGVASPWFNRCLLIRLGLLFFQLWCDNREASRILKRISSGKVGREMGSGRCTVVSIVESSICFCGVYEAHKSKAGKVEHSWEQVERWSPETTELKLGFFPDETQTSSGRMIQQEKGPITRGNF